jgi:hypothetical protein
MKTRQIPVPGSTPPARRGVSSVLFTLVGFVAGCVAMFGSLALLHAELRPGQAEPSSSSIVPSMDATAALREHIPPAIEPSCQPGNLRYEATNDSVYASVVCSRQIQGATVQVQYMSVHDKIALVDLFRGQLDQSGIQHVAPSTEAAGMCGSSPPSAGAFRWFGKTDEMTGDVVHAFSLPSTGPRTQGLVACYIGAAGTAWLDWIDYDTHIYAFASSSIEHYGALFAWWLGQAGPFHPRHQAMSGNTVPSGATPTMSPQM